MFYADDPKENPDPLMSKLKSFIDDIRIRMERNFLKLNYSKTEYGSSVNFSNLSVLSVTVGYCKIPIASSVKNLGVMLDRLLNMDNFVKSKARNINMNLRKCKGVWTFFTQDACKVQATAQSHLDYCSSLLYGIIYRSPDLSASFI